MNVKNDITGNNSDDKADVPWSMPEYRVPSPDESSQEAQGNAVEAVDHHFLYPGPEVKFIHRESGSDENS